MGPLAGPFSFTGYMRTLNFKSRHFAVGKTVVIINEYRCGQICLAVGDTGKIVGANVHNYPDLGLFNIRVIDFRFSNCDVSMGQEIAEKHMEVL